MSLSHLTLNPLLSPTSLISPLLLDCEQSLFFFRFSKGSAHARASGEAARRAKRGPSVSRVAIRVSRVLLDGLQKKERLLVVYLLLVSSTFSGKES